MTFEQFTQREVQRIPDVAAFAAVSKGTVYAAIERGDLKAWRYGNLLRVRTVDALAWLGMTLPGGHGEAK